MKWTKTIYKCLLCTGIAISNPGGVFSQSLDWAAHFGGGGWDEGVGIATDADGNIYSAANFQDTADFDPGPGIVNLVSQGHYDIALIKQDNAGNVIWVKQIGGSGDDHCTAIAVDGGGNVCITGTFLGTADFDPGPAVFNMTSTASLNTFVCKLDASGNFVWAKKFSEAAVSLIFPYPVISNAIVVDKAGSVYTTGSFDGKTDFDPGTDSFYLSPGSVGISYTTDAFICKLDASGNFVWARQLGGPDTSFDAGHAITLDSLGNIYSTGFFNGKVDFDPGAGTFLLEGPMPVTGLTDVYVSKLDASGNFVWATQIEGASPGKGIAVDKGGNVYACANYTNDSAIIFKLDPSGSLVWAKETGGSWCWSLAVDPADNVYNTGQFFGTKDFDPGAGVFTLTGNSDAYISKLDAGGNFVWAKKIGGTEQVWSQSLAVPGNDQILTIGYFSDTANFDPGSAGFNLVASGSYDMFIQKLKAEQVGMAELALSDTFQIYPNPTAGKFVVAFKKDCDDCTLLLRNVLGQVIDKRSVRKGRRFAMEIRNPPGIYTLEIYQQDGRKGVARIVKK